MNTQYKSAVRIFLERLVVRGVDECWDWDGTKDTKGYGRFRFDHKTIISHRYSYEYWVGKIPEGLVIDHLCNNTSCQNPRHLDPKTIIDNARRGYKYERKNMLSRGVCPKGLHKTETLSDVYTYKGSYTCRKCKNTPGSTDAIRERDRIRKRREYWARKVVQV